MTTKEERLAKLEEKMENTCQKLDDFEGNYSEFKAKVFEKLDSINDKIARIETKLETQVGLSEVANLKCNYSGTSAPTVNNDSSQGYAVGSRWLDTTNNDEYVCLNATAGNAVWKKTT